MTAARDGRGSGRARMGGQALVEVGLLLPVLLLLALGTAVVGRVADARAGLDAATAAAAAAAARAPDAATASASARSAFAGASALYGLSNPVLSLRTADFARGSAISADGRASVDLSFGALPGLPASVTLHSQARAQVERWRSR